MSGRITRRTKYRAYYSLASYAKINEYGFIMTPYRKVEDKKLTDQIDYLTADEEHDYVITHATTIVDKDNSRRRTSCNAIG